MTASRQDLMLVGCVLITLVSLANGATSAAGKPTRRTFVVPARTALDVRLATVVASESNRSEDPVLASLATPVIVDGVSVAPAASVLMGSVIEGTAAGSGEGPERTLRFDRLRVGATTYDIRTAPVRIPSDAASRFRLELLEPVSIDVHRPR